jgi:hypothetical protein
MALGKLNSRAAHRDTAACTVRKDTAIRIVTYVQQKYN